MGSAGNQDPWLPYENTKECSQGSCSIYCPHWCYIMFPPPPPLFSDDDQGSSGPTLSPLVIAIIGVLATAFLLVSYYTIVSKYCSSGGVFHRRLRRPADGAEDDLEDYQPGAQYDTWHVPPSNGLDEALINKITVCRYKRGDGLVDGTDCSVCLSEFQDDQSLRLLPKCRHAFHVHCIDTWLKSHSNCPLCRANIISISPPTLQLPAPPVPPEPNLTTAAAETEPNIEAPVAIVEERREEEQNELENDADGAKEASTPASFSCDSEQNRSIIEVVEDGDQSVRRSFSMDFAHRGRISIVDVLRVSIEDEFLKAKEHGLSTGPSSWRRGGGEHSKVTGGSRGLNCAMSPVPMKRSFSGGRFCFTRNGKGRSSVLPL